MPARDIYHDQVKNALIKDGWTITHDPYLLRWGGKDTFVDLGAEEIIAAEKAELKIAVEIKSFISKSEMHDLEQAFGQYMIYHLMLTQAESDRMLYLAVSKSVYKSVFEEPIGRLLLEEEPLRLLVFEPDQEVILRWIPHRPTTS